MRKPQLTRMKVTPIRAWSVDVDNADHDSQSEAHISEDEEFSEYDETDNDVGNFYIGRDKQTRCRKTQIAPRAKTRGKNIGKKIP